MFANLSKKICFVLFSMLICSHISFTKSKKNNKTMSQQARRRRYRLRHSENERSKNPEPHSNISFSKLTTKQLEEKLPYARLVKDQEMELKILEQLTKTHTENSNFNTYMLELADFYFELGTFDKAIEYYLLYKNFYPGSQEAEYAFYKAIVATFYTTLAPNRDSLPTEKTIELATQFLTQVVRKDYEDEIRIIIQQCKDKLFLHEVYVFEHYVKQKKYSSARMRLDYMKKHFLDCVADAKRLVPHLEELLERAENPKTRTFFINVDFDYGLNPDKKSAPQERHVSRIRV